MRALSEEPEESRRFFGEALRAFPQEQRKLDEWFASVLPEGERVELNLDCFGIHVFGKRGIRGVSSLRLPGLIRSKVPTGSLP